MPLNNDSLNKTLYSVRKSYLAVIKEVQKEYPNLQLSGADNFFFRNNKRVNEKINALLLKLRNEVYSATILGAENAWEQATEENNEIAQKVFGKNVDQLPARYREKYFSTNGAARRSFFARKENGLNLSDRVWRNTRQFKQELELAIEIGLKNGQSAASLSRNIRQYLVEPNKLFRRVRDKETGELRLSKAAKAYKPGRGVYRSSYKNALRLTANEINFSYEESNYLKRQQQDFVVGIEIKVSPRHKRSDDKGGISCYNLQGLYPKGFKWSNKWHPNCRCSSFTVLKTEEELERDDDLILAGKAPSASSENTVKKLPDGYKSESKKWLEKSEDWKNQPRTFAENTKE